VLVYICVTQGTDGADWSDAIATLDDLLWNVQPLEHMADVERREGGLTHLLDRVERHMMLVNLPDSDIEGHLTTLHARIREIADADQAFLQEDAGNPDAREHDLPDLSMMEEIVLASPEDRAAIEDPEPEPEMVREINLLTEGVWVEMTGETGERIRCKLATIVQPGNRYIFVNRRGMKVAEKNRMAVAVELKRRTLTVLDESQVFDRALEAVIGNLRSYTAVRLLATDAAPFVPPTPRRCRHSDPTEPAQTHDGLCPCVDFQIDPVTDVTVPCRAPDRLEQAHADLCRAGSVAAIVSFAHRALRNLVVQIRHQRGSTEHHPPPVTAVTTSTTRATSLTPGEHVATDSSPNRSDRSTLTRLPTARSSTQCGKATANHVKRQRHWDPSDVRQQPRSRRRHLTGHPPGT
jgi:hypothetical protein